MISKKSRSYFLARVAALRDLVPATRANSISQEWMGKIVENEAHQLLQKTMNDPIARLQTVEERASSSDGRFQNLSVWIVKILQVFFYVGHNLI